MARPRTVDREKLLATAEELVVMSGVSALTFGKLAEAAGVPKASVQSAFGTREALIEAMVERWQQDELQRFRKHVGTNSSLRARMRAHIRTTAEETPASHKRSASLVAALAEMGSKAEGFAEWYEARVGRMRAQVAAEKRMRIAFLAAEGAYYMRFLGGYRMTDTQWREIFADLLAFVDEDNDRKA